MTVETTISKDQIVAYHDLIGCANRSRVTIDGTDYGPGEVQFLGFRGAHVGGGQYRGVFAYAHAVCGEERIDDFPTVKDTTDAESSIDPID